MTCMQARKARFEIRAEQQTQLPIYDSRQPIRDCVLERSAHRHNCLGGWRGRIHVFFRFGLVLSYEFALGLHLRVDKGACAALIWAPAALLWQEDLVWLSLRDRFWHFLLALHSIIKTGSFYGDTQRSTREMSHINLFSNIQLAQVSAWIGVATTTSATQVGRNFAALETPWLVATHSGRTPQN